MTNNHDVCQRAFHISLMPISRPIMPNFIGHPISTPAQMLLHFLIVSLLITLSYVVATPEAISTSGNLTPMDISSLPYSHISTPRCRVCHNIRAPKGQPDCAACKGWGFILPGNQHCLTCKGKGRASAVRKCKTCNGIGSISNEKHEEMKAKLDAIMQETMFLRASVILESPGGNKAPSAPPKLRASTRPHNRSAL